MNHSHRSPKGNRQMRRRAQSSGQCRGQDQRQYLRAGVSPAGPAPRARTSHWRDRASSLSPDLEDSAPGRRVRGARTGRHQTPGATARRQDDPGTPKPRLPRRARTFSIGYSSMSGVMIFDPGSRSSARRCRFPDDQEILPKGILKSVSMILTRHGIFAALILALPAALSASPSKRPAAPASRLAPSTSPARSARSSPTAVSAAMGPTPRKRKAKLRLDTARGRCSRSWPPGWAIVKPGDPVEERADSPHHHRRRSRT